MLLSIDSSAGASVALVSGTDTPEVLAEASTDASNTHAEWLAAAVNELLRQADVNPANPTTLTGVVAGVGPGPFTGLRVGLALAQSLSLGWGLPLHGICSLDGLALRAVESGIADGEFLVVTDARRREVYWAKYENDDDGSRLLEGPFVGPAAQLPDLPAVGLGASLYAQELHTPEELSEAHTWLPRASELGLLAAGALAGELSGVFCAPRPLYLRESDAKVPAQMKQARGAGQPSGSGASAQGASA